MADLKPWYKVVTPREDLREGKPLDASEFAVHLDKVTSGTAPKEYTNPELFFERTYLTQTLTDFASQVIRRLSGEITNTSPVFNLITQFGGGKTHALTLAYHLGKGGSSASGWMGVNKLIAKAGISSIPSAEVAVFVGTEFDSLTGRGGADGTPLRKTPWGEIAFQLSGVEGFNAVEEHDRRMTAPAGDVIRKFLPQRKPCLILMDEVMNYIGRNRKSGLAEQFYSFLHNLSETVRGERNVVLAVSLQKSEILEMNPEDQADYQRLRHLLDRVGKAMMMSSDLETGEIIRRRLFDWDLNAIDQNGRILLRREASNVCNEYAEWAVDHRGQIPGWFASDNAREIFTAAYPFHPITLSVFDRKWQTLPMFQQTRGILRLLALWVSRAYQDGFKGAHRDPLIGLGSAPLDDPNFRVALFEQMGESRLESVITTDIAGNKNSISTRLDKEAVETIKKHRLHQQVATAILFESSGGMIKKEATLPELRLAVAAPGMDIGNVETVLEELSSRCHYLSVSKNSYYFGLTPNLIKLFSDRTASIKAESIKERALSEIRTEFDKGQGVERIYFPDKSSQIIDRPALSLVVIDPNKSMQNTDTLRLLESMTKEYGASARTYKSGVIWAIAESGQAINDEVRKALAWEDIQNSDAQKLEENQKKELNLKISQAKRDVKEVIWRNYKNIVLLNKDNGLRVIDLGLVHSSAANSIIAFMLGKLKSDDTLTDSVSPNKLINNWPPAFTEWTTKSVRDVFYASPNLPRLTHPDILKDTIARGVANGILAYVGKAASGKYEPFYFGKSIGAGEIEFSDDMFILKGDDAKKALEPPTLTRIMISPAIIRMKTCQQERFLAKGLDQNGNDLPLSDIAWSSTGGDVTSDGVFTAGSSEGAFTVNVACGGIKGVASVTIAAEYLPLPTESTPGIRHISWQGEIPHQKWMNFYTKVLSKYANSGGLRLNVSVNISPASGISDHNIEEIKIVLRELGLDENNIEAS